MPEAPETPAGGRIISNAQFAERMGVSRTTLWRMERQAEAAGRWFPPKIQISKNRVGWLERHVDRLVEELVAASSDAAA